jgi:hypothetical protein
MRRLISILAVAALSLPGTALGKGPTAASMEGPGASRITFGGDEGSGPLGNLTQQSGWFAGAFAQEPNPMLSARPNGDLGPKYTVSYTVPGPDGRTQTIRQDLYPYAPDGPVTYMAPGQPIFDMETPGGWFQAGRDLKDTLVAAGLPEAPPTTSGGGSFPTVELLGLLAAALLLVAATAVVLRRRAHPAPAA